MPAKIDGDSFPRKDGSHTLFDVLTERNRIARLCTTHSISKVLSRRDGSPGHTGAAHDQHTGHSQAAESVHQVALFEHRLVPVDQIADGSLGKLHATILHPWFSCSHVRMGRWRKSRLFRHSILKDRQPIK
ncbi:hypothetical protein [Desulfovibrio sp.]|uniref:hypothetical protein n=1 Tax=Desulfovibrio sp. TaxID=885 RepID=UPI003AB1D524